MFLLILTVVFYIIRPSFYSHCESYPDPETGITLTRCCSDVKDHQSCINMPGKLGQHTIAIAFSRTEKRVVKVLNDVSDCHIDEMKKETYIDFIFIAVYTIFLLMFVYTTSRILRRDPIMLIAILPLVSMTADIMENLYLLETFDLFIANNMAGMEEVAFKTYIFTLIKWFSLAFTFLFIGAVIVRGNQWYKLVTFLLFVPLLLGIGHFFYAPLEFWFFISSFAAFLWLFLVAVFFRGHKSSRGIYV